MKDVLAPDTLGLKGLKHVFEIAGVRLVGADVFGGIDCVEGNPKARIASREAFPINIREYDELIMLFQISERNWAVREGWPIRYGATESTMLLLLCADPPFLSQPVMNAREQIRVTKSRRLHLLRGF